MYSLYFLKFALFSLNLHPVYFSHSLCLDVCLSLTLSLSLSCCVTQKTECTVYVITIPRGHIGNKRNDDHQIVIIFTATLSRDKANT